MFADRLRLVVALVALALGGCGDHELDLSLALATDSCTIAIPAGGSVLYQINAGGASDGGSSSFCGGCLPVNSTLADANAIVAFLRANAPACAGVKPGTSLAVSLRAFSTANCPSSPAPLFCSTSQPVTIPDGHSDAVVSVVMTCDPTCAGSCTPTTCQALGKNCGAVSDGCGKTLMCGMCMPPNVCGGHNGGGVPNVCSK